VVASQWRNYAELMHIETPDAETLVINYDAPLKSSIDVLALAYMADPQTFDQLATGSSFVGTGPFRFKEWVQGDHVAVVRNPDYREAGKPYLDGVELRVFSDPATAVTALEANALDWLTAVPGHDAKRLGNDPSYSVLLSGNGGTFFFVGFDLTVPEIADPRVRQAFAYALNRSRIVDVALDGFGRPACIVWPRQSIGYDDAQDRGYGYDVNRARALLQSAGWDSTRVIQLVTQTFVPLTQVVAEIMQADLQSIGVQVAVQTLSGAEFNTRGQSRKIGGAWISPMAFTSLSPATYLMTASMARVPNTSNFMNQRYNDLIHQATTATDDAALKAILHDVTQIMLDDPFIIPFAEGAGQLSGPEVVRNRVNGTHWDGFGLYAYEDVWLNQ
jgi:peptide/nickel transport system substrate-binding protein